VWSLYGKGLFEKSRSDSILNFLEAVSQTIVNDLRYFPNCCLFYHDHYLSLFDVLHPDLELFIEEIEDWSL